MPTFSTPQRRATLWTFIQDLRIARHFQPLPDAEAEAAVAIWEPILSPISDDDLFDRGEGTFFQFIVMDKKFEARDIRAAWEANVGRSERIDEAQERRVQRERSEKTLPKEDPARQELLRYLYANGISEEELEAAANGDR